MPVIINADKELTDNQGTPKGKEGEHEMRKVSAFTITTFILVGIILFSITGTVFSQSANKSKIEDKYRNQMEEDYIQEVREFLEEKNMSNSGITMTKVIYENGQMEYEVTIHNRAIDLMSYYEQQKLQQELQKISFPDSSSTVSHEFLKI